MQKPQSARFRGVQQCFIDRTPSATQSFMGLGDSRQIGWEGAALGAALFKDQQLHLALAEYR